MKITRKVCSLILTVLFVFSLAVTATAVENDLPSYSEAEIAMYSDLYEQDQEAIAEIMVNLPAMLAAGNLAAQNDVKANMPVVASGSSLGSFGDILVSLIIDSGSVGFAGHAGIVSSNSTITIESYAQSCSPINKDGVQYYDNTWGTQSGALLVRPYNATIANFQQAALFASQKIGKPYNWNFTNKTTTDAYYCSQLVWQAWLSAGIDCETGSVPNAIIAPADLVNSSNTYIVQQVA